MERFVRLAVLFVLHAISTLATAQTNQPQSLAGEWRFEMDRSDAGTAEKWFGRDLNDRIQLPGILQSQGYGDEISTDTPWVAGLPRDMRWYNLPQYQPYTKPGHVKMPYLSQPARHYLGVAWYQRDIDISPTWQGRRIVLTLERPRWETTVWVDDAKIGACHSLVAPHQFDLGTLPPGRHRLSIRVDNRMILPYRPDGHSVSDAEGQTWNGIVGRIELTSTSPVRIDDAQVFPNPQDRSVRVRVRIGNATGQPGSGTIAVGTAGQPVQWTATGTDVDIKVRLDPNTPLWNEFSPALQHLTVHLTGDKANDSRDLTFGLREIKTDGKRLLLNGIELNLRGTHDGGGFPLTGYPATDVESWKHIIQTCKDWGLNAIRFHSWCPPEAAFTAADELGFYLQPECGMWNNFDTDGKMLAVLNDETERLLTAYGNHPSFLLLAATNEPAGRYKTQLPDWNKNWRRLDPRHLYTDGSGRLAQSTLQPSESDFAVSADSGLAGRIRGPGGWFGRDYEASLKGVRIPVITHELGQWCAYPDFDVIGKFTGHLRPGNYEIARDFAESAGLLARNKDLAHASGRFQVACYKEEIEANLRTPGLSGFQLLDLHDYLGQGTAPVGVLDAFWEPKGYVTADEFKRFCNTTVVLARLKDRVLTSADTLSVDLEAAHYGPTALKGVTPYWRLEDATGRVIFSGECAVRDLPIGKNHSLGRVSADLSAITAPTACKLIAGLRGTAFENSWNLWVYPKQSDAIASADVTVTSSWPEAEAQLQAGAKVLFQPLASDLDADNPKLSATPIFWNRVMNGRGTTFLGLWCDATHPALAGFPTEANCDWQWIAAAQDARALNLDRLPKTLQPIVQPIEDWARGYKLGLIYECRVGSGRLMVCSVDLAAKTPPALAFRKSLLDYMQGERFQPTTELAIDDLREQWLSTRKGAGPSKSASQPAQPQAPEIDAAPDLTFPRGKLP